MVPSLARALADLVRYVAARPGAATEDDDVRALEGTAATLASLPQEEQQRLRVLMGQEAADALGFEGE